MNGPLVAFRRMHSSNNGTAKLLTDELAVPHRLLHFFVLVLRSGRCSPLPCVDVDDGANARWQCFLEVPDQRFASCAVHEIDGLGYEPEPNVRVGLIYTVLLVPSLRQRQRSCWE